MGRFALTQKMMALKDQHLVRRKITLTTEGSRRSVMMLAAVLLSLGVVYLWQVNAVAAIGYEMRDLEARVQTLQKENKKLELAVTEKQSTAHVMKRLEELAMVPAGVVSYVQATSVDVALAQ